jgi:hypothetical protein
MSIFRTALSALSIFATLFVAGNYVSMEVYGNQSVDEMFYKGMGAESDAWGRSVTNEAERAADNTYAGE